MTASVRPGEGTLLQLQISTTYTNIGRVLSVGGPKPKVPSIDTTVLTSTRREKRPSQIPDSGQCTVRIQYDPNDATVHQLLLTQMEAGTVSSWKVVYNTANTTTNANEVFSAFITDFTGNDKEVDTNVEADLTLEITGAITRTAGT